MRKVNGNDIDRFRETALKYYMSSNFFGSAGILYEYADNGNLYISESRAGIFVFARADGFFRLYFALTDMDAPPGFNGITEPLVSETVYREVRIPQSADYFVRHGFSRSLVRSRMSLNMTNTEKTDVKDEPLADIYAVYKLFSDSFDPYTGCIPTLNALKKASGENRVITAVQDGGLCGALLYDNTGASSTLNNIAVAENMRGCGYGGYLVSEWIKRCASDGKSVLRLWVADGNTPAIGLYGKYGFQTDGLKSSVLIKY